LLLTLFILSVTVRDSAVTASVSRVVVGAASTLTNLVAQSTASQATSNGANRPQNGTRSSACSAASHRTYCFSNVRVAHVGAPRTVPIAIVVSSHVILTPLFCIRDTLLFSAGPEHILPAWRGRIPAYIIPKMLHSLKVS
jgi:hypothetical protein